MTDTLNSTRDKRLLWTCAGSSAELQDTAEAFDLSTRVCTVPDLGGLVRPVAGDVVAIDLDADPAGGLAAIRQLHTRVPGAAILAAATDVDDELMRSALAAGAVDVLALPVTAHELRKALLRSTHVRRPTPSNVSGHVISVYGARGGLGATTLAVNLAFKLDGVTDHEVALFDLDLQRGDVAAFCDLNPVHSVANLATAPSEVDDAFLASTLVRHARGVSILAAPATIEEADLVTEHEVEVALRLLRARCAYTVIDTPRSLTASVVTALEQSDRILLLSDLSVPSVRAARRALELFGRLKIPLEHVDLVITEAVAGPVDVRKAVEVIGKEVFAVLPKDDAAGAAMNDGVPLNGRPTRLAVAVDTLARRLANVPAAPKGRGLLQRFLPKGARP